MAGSTFAVTSRNSSGALGTGTESSYWTKLSLVILFKTSFFASRIHNPLFLRPTRPDSAAGSLLLSSRSEYRAGGRRGRSIQVLFSRRQRQKTSKSNRARVSF